MFSTPDASALIDRVHGTIKSAPARLTASIGVACTPLRPLTGHPPREVLEEIVAVATHAMCQARTFGGNHVNYLHDPPLTVLNDPNLGSEDGTPM